MTLVKILSDGQHNIEPSEIKWLPILMYFLVNRKIHINFVDTVNA